MKLHARTLPTGVQIVPTLGASSQGFWFATVSIAEVWEAILTILTFLTLFHRLRGKSAAAQRRRGFFVHVKPP